METALMRWFIPRYSGLSSHVLSSISFMMDFDPARDPQAREHLKATSETLSEGGTPLKLDA